MHSNFQIASILWMYVLRNPSIPGPYKNAQGHEENVSNTGPNTQSP